MSAPARTEEMEQAIDRLWPIVERYMAPSPLPKDAQRQLLEIVRPHVSLDGKVLRACVDPDNPFDGPIILLHDEAEKVDGATDEGPWRSVLQAALMLGGLDQDTAAEIAWHEEEKS